MANVDGLTAVLAGGYGSDNLGHDGAGYLEASGAFDKLTVHNGTVVQHIADINQAAVENRLNEIVRVMEMEHALFMSLGNLFRQHDALGQVLGNLAGDQIALSSSHGGVFVGVFLHNVLIAVADQRKNGFVSGIGLTHQSTLVTIDNISLGQLKFTLVHQAMLHHILNILYQKTHAITLLHMLGNLLDFVLLDSIFRLYSRICLLNSNDYLAAIEVYGGAITLNDLHASPSFLLKSYLWLWK